MNLSFLDQHHEQESDRMHHYNRKILRGSIVRGKKLQLPRARAIYRAACRHNYAEVLQCQRNNDMDEIITIKLTRLQIPENPVYPILTEEIVSVVCRKRDNNWPEVYVTRKDFPLGLPHSNVTAYKRPISICVNDFYFYETRLQFSAFDYINDIRSWFEKNSVGELHDQNRPLEMLMLPDRVCTLLNEIDTLFSYVIYKKITDRSSTLEKAEVNTATHYLITIGTNPTISKNIVYKPQKLGELSELVPIDENESVLGYLSVLCERMPERARSLPLLLRVLINQRHANLDKIQYELFVISPHISACDILNNKKRFSAEHYDKWLKDLPIAIDIMHFPLTRELNRLGNATAISIPAITMIGVGTLGSNVMDHLIRKGVCEKMTVVDYDIYLPHNHGRHVLPSNNVMENKARAMTQLYNKINNQKLVTVAKNALDLSLTEQTEFYKKANLIIDASTVIALERYLARGIELTNGRCCSVFLNPQGTDLVVLFEDKVRNNRLDLLEMDYYHQLIINDALASHMKWPQEQLINTFSCREKSHILDYDNIGLLASIASREIQRHYNEDTASAEVWQINETTGEVGCVNIPINSWNLYYSGDVKIYVSQSLLDAMNEQRMQWGTLETGGCLYGCYDRDRNIIYVFAQITAPSDSVHNHDSFIRGKEGVFEAQQRIAERTYFQVRYIGEWHSHPIGGSNPSVVDKQQFEALNYEALQQDIPFVQIICAPNGFFVRGRI